MELLPLHGSRRDDVSPASARPAGAAPGRVTAPRDEAPHAGDRWLPSTPPAAIAEPLSAPVAEAPGAGAERPLKPSITARGLLGLDKPAKNEAPAPSANPSVLLQNDSGAPVTAAELKSEPTAPLLGSARDLQAVPTDSRAPLLGSALDLGGVPPAGVSATHVEKPLTALSKVPDAERPGLLTRMKQSSREMFNTLLSLAGKGDDTIPLEAPLARINALGPTFAAMSDVELKGMTENFKTRLAAGESLDSIMPEAYAVVREASGRALGYKPYDVQVEGAIAMYQGKIAEMRTGEGKTLTATMPAYLHALEGKGVHVVTVNQTLASRDAENMGKLYNWLGMSVGVVPEDPLKMPEKREAYNADITYATNYSLGFDFLRDNMVRHADEKVCREPNFALIDEVDEILIDEARTPLILSKTEQPSAQEYKRFADIVKTLKPGTDYKVDYKQRQCWLTDEGQAQVEKQAGVDNLYSEQNMHLVPYLRASLIANTLFVRDKDYMVSDGKVDIVDEFTGRVMDGRRYNDGIHQALEAKEGVDIQPEQTTMASITYPNLFRRYHKVAGMSGTAKTEESEFQDLYGMNVAVIPPNRPSQRVDKPDLVYKSYQEKFNAVADRVQRLAEEGRPVLIGTRNVATNEYLHQLLNARGVPHQVLNARSVQENTAAENEIIARAGKSGMVTLATNMAGRGVDIKPDTVNFKQLTTEAVESVRSGQRVVIVLSKKGEADDARLWLGVNQIQVSDALPKASEAKAETLFAPPAEQPAGAEASPPLAAAQVQLVIDDGSPLPQMPGTVVLQSTDERFATGGLHIIGTERHESRRIDNQLKGRSGRQGNPGETQFFLSLDDELMRLFGGDRLKRLFDRLGVKEGQAVSDGMLDKAISSAQEKIEGMHFDVRKNTTKYDGVLNIHRGLFYKDREDIVNGADVSSMLSAWAADGVDKAIENANVGKRVSAEQGNELWNGLRERYALPDTLRPPSLSGDGKVEVATLRKELLDAIDGRLQAQRARFGEETWKSAMSDLALDSLDEGWFNHLENMQSLQSGVGLEAYAQKDPWIAYQERSFEQWNAMKSDVAANVLRTAIAA